jgi:geranylgeranyl reductase family protein
MSRTEGDADVIVVGAGPAGSTTAYYLAQAGLDVLLLEKSAFPRDKVCGDGLTPRAVRQLSRMGVDTTGPGWIRNNGLRVVAGGMRLHMPWPELASYPDYGLVRTRTDFDEVLARHAQKSGAGLEERTSVTSPVMDERTGRICGVTARPLDADGRPAGPAATFRAPLVVAADGVSSRLSGAMGIHKRDDRPMGVAVRTYFTTPRHDDDWMESWLELPEKDQNGRESLLPGYGWIFGTGNGTSNVGLGVLNTSRAFRRVDYKQLLRRWVAQTPQEWGFTEENQVGDIRSAALPMAFNRYSSVTQAGWSTPSTARASTTPWRRPVWRRRSSPTRRRSAPRSAASGCCRPTRQRSSTTTAGTSPSAASSSS